MNLSLDLALALGFLLGFKHATEADHLVAVTTIVSEQRSILRAGFVGALWGVGHTVSLLVAGILVIVLEITIPLRLANALEFAVALMIILLGARVLYLALRGQRRVHTHRHQHDGYAHTHIHFHEAEDAHTAQSTTRTHQHARLVGWRPLVVGMVHGLAGSAVLTFLVLTEVVKRGSRALGLAYLLVFGIGSICGMLLMSTLISLPIVLTSRRFERIEVPMRIIVGGASVAFGFYYAWAIAVG
jgi:ABC-type nickel/cobalt efflux system permease component RcnA